MIHNPRHEPLSSALGAIARQRASHAAQGLHALLQAHDPEYMHAHMHLYAHTHTCARALTRAPAGLCQWRPERRCCVAAHVRQRNGARWWAPGAAAGAVVCQEHGPVRGARRCTVIHLQVRALCAAAALGGLVAHCLLPCGHGYVLGEGGERVG